jgi:hypothetical protein
VRRTLPVEDDGFMEATLEELRQIADDVEICIDREATRAEREEILARRVRELRGIREELLRRRRVPLSDPLDREALEKIGELATELKGAAELANLLTVDGLAHGVDPSHAITLADEMRARIRALLAGPSTTP